MLLQMERPRAAMAGAEALTRAGRAAEAVLRDNMVVVMKLKASAKGLVTERYDSSRGSISGSRCKEPRTREVGVKLLTNFPMSRLVGLGR